jgi:phosphatidylglycerol lysyltransferase
MGFTLGRFDSVSACPDDCRVAVDGDGRVVAFVTWHRFNDNRARVLDLMRRLPDAPNPAIDLLIGESLTRFAAAGVEQASLGSVPMSHGRLAERVYPTRSLRRFKDKFAPDWQPRYLAAPSRAHAPAALVAVARAYSSGGLCRALRRNG